MLKAHQACIDLEKGVLRIQGREVKFLSEHELPDKARDPELREQLDAATLASASSSSSSGAASQASRNVPSSFPGGGRTIGAAPSSGVPAPQRAASQQQQQQQRTTNYPEQSISILMDLGAPRELAISTLDAAGGNVDVAASLLF